jgi:hypothetical protein
MNVRECHPYIISLQDVLGTVSECSILMFKENVNECSLGTLAACFANEAAYVTLEH